MILYALEYTRFPGKFVKHLWTVKTKGYLESILKERQARGGTNETLDNHLHLEFAVPLEKAKFWTTERSLWLFRRRVIRDSVRYDLDTQKMTSTPITYGQDLSEYRVRMIDTTDMGTKPF